MPIWQEKILSDIPERMTVHGEKRRKDKCHADIGAEENQLTRVIIT